MTLNQIKYVLEISKSDSMREAASHLYISQPALTASISALEEELGFLVFERTNKGVALTEDGREFVNYAKQVINQYEVMEERFFSSDRTRERFSVSSQHYTFAVDAFSDLIMEYNPEKFTFSFHETKTSEVLTHVREMKSEVGIISYSETNRSIMEKILKTYRLEFVPLMQRETYAYVWKDHVLAGLDHISLEQLKDYPCVVFDQSEKEEHYFQEEALANVDFDKKIKSADRATSMELIARTNGYAIGSGMLSDVSAVLKGLVAIKLDEEDTLTIGYIYRKNAKLSQYAKRYINLLETYGEIESK